MTQNLTDEQVKQIWAAGRRMLQALREVKVAQTLEEARRIAQDVLGVVDRKAT